MDACSVAAALEDAWFDARQNFRHEDLGDDVRGRAELAEWERLAHLLADAAPGTVYDPDADDVVQAQLAADTAAAAAREAELREAARIAARADELQALRELGTLEQTEPPFAGAYAVLGPLLSDVRRDKGREWAGVVCLLVAAMGFCLAVAAFISGHLTGFGNIPDPMAVCNPPSAFETPGQARDRVLITVSVLPVSVVCADSPGGSHATEMVAAWVNPTIAVGSSTALLGLLLAPFAPRLLASAMRRRT